MNDIVYVVKEWPRDSIELRYSLRSLDNIPHWNVFIVWYKPRRARWVIHIPAEDKWHKFDNVINKYRIICNDDRISNDFILMHDDNFIIKQIDDIDYYIRSTLKEHKDIIFKKFWKNKYYISINWAYELFPEWDSFDVHTPIKYNKEKFKYIIDTYWNSKASKRSIYCNYYNIKWTKLISWLHDCKITKDSEISVKPSQIFLSSDNFLAYDYQFISILNTLFPRMCKYELINCNLNIKEKKKNVAI